MNTESNETQGDSGVGSIPLPASGSVQPSQDSEKTNEGRSKEFGLGYVPQSTKRREAYKELLDESEDLTGDDLEDSQLGITIWTAEEKQVFFHALALNGRIGFQGVATAIGSKSEVEVSAYCELLESKLRELYLQGDPKRWLLRPEDMPAACEVSEECCRMLEDATRGIQDDQDEQSQSRATIPELLAIDTFPQLSKDIFMDSSRPEHDWRTYSTLEKAPSVESSTLKHLNALVVDHTRRLVSSALFLASSRIRASTRPDRTPQSLVRPDDVEAAVKILGLDASSYHFWVDLARRNGLDVHRDLSHHGEDREVLRLRDVERRLRRPGNLRTIDDDMATDSAESALSTSSDEDAQLSQMSTLPTTAGTDNPSLDQDSRQQIQEEIDPLDAHLDYLDMLASRREEIRLWKLLGREPPMHLVDELNKDHDLPEGPIEEPLTWDEQRDWRLYTDSTPAWIAHDALEMVDKPIRQRTS